jgi:ribonuclease BN (tRNA processing enzyme)
MYKDIKLKFLGTGSAFSREYGNTSAIVEVTNNDVTQRLLIDCGRTTPDDLHRAGYTWKDIDAIFITHLHGDHVYGLEDAGFFSYFVHKRKIHLILPEQSMKSQLWERVLKGTMMRGDLDRNMEFRDYYTHEIVGKEEPYFIFNGVMFSVYRTVHVQNKQSYGLIIGERDYIIYTGDSLLDKGLLEYAVEDGCVAIFHDCQMMHYDGSVHASLDDLLTLDDHIRGLIYIMHYGDDIKQNYYKIKDNKLSIALKGQEYSYKVI